jgi:hypothetical protein
MDIRAFLSRPETLALGGVVIALVGTIVSAIGAYRASIEQNDFNRQLSEKNQEIANLAKLNLASVTGGQEFVDVHPQLPLDHPGEVTFSVSKQGIYPAFDVVVQIEDTRALGDFVHSHITPHGIAATSEQVQSASERVSNFPSVFPNSTINLGSYYPVNDLKPRSFRVEVFARNGHARWEWYMRWVKDHWAFASKLRKTILGKDEPEVETVNPELREANEIFLWQ